MVEETSCLIIVRSPVQSWASLPTFSKAYQLFLSLFSADFLIGTLWGHIKRSVQIVFNSTLNLFFNHESKSGLSKNRYRGISCPKQPQPGKIGKHRTHRKNLAYRSRSAWIGSWIVRRWMKMSLSRSSTPICLGTDSLVSILTIRLATSPPFSFSVFPDLNSFPAFCVSTGFDSAEYRKVIPKLISIGLQTARGVAEQCWVGSISTYIRHILAK